MSEKQQHTAARMRESMINRYDDGLYHKHNKLHSYHRLHSRSHPTHVSNDMDETHLHGSTGILQRLKIKKMRKYLLAKLGLH